MKQAKYEFATKAQLCFPSTLWCFTEKISNDILQVQLQSRKESLTFFFLVLFLFIMPVLAFFGDYRFSIAFFSFLCCIVLINKVCSYALGNISKASKPEIYWIHLYWMSSSVSATISLWSFPKCVTAWTSPTAAQVASFSPGVLLRLPLCFGGSMARGKECISVHLLKRVLLSLLVVQPLGKSWG